MRCGSKCDLNSYVNNDNLIASLLDQTLNNFGIDTIFITGSENWIGMTLENAIAAKKLGYKTFVIKDTQPFLADDLNMLTEIGIGMIDSSILLKGRYSCPDNWLQCPLSGKCISSGFGLRTHTMPECRISLWQQHPKVVAVHTM